MPKSTFRAPNTPMRAKLLHSSDFNSFLSHKWVEYLCYNVPNLITAKKNPAWLAIPNITLVASITLLIVWKIQANSLLKSSHILRGRKQSFQNFLRMLIGVNVPAVYNGQEQLKTMKQRISFIENKIPLQLKSSA